MPRKQYNACISDFITFEFAFFIPLTLIRIIKTMTTESTPKALEITDASFETTIQSNRPVLIDFWAAWCGPCRTIAPVIEELAQEQATEGQFVVAKLDVDQNAESAIKYGVRSIPTLIIFKNGQEVDRLLGGQHAKEVLKARLAQHIG